MKGLFQCPPRAAPWVMLAKNKVALKGQKLSISKLLPFQGDFVVSILKPRALPWAKSFCPFRAYGMWFMTHPLLFPVTPLLKETAILNIL